MISCVTSDVAGTRAIAAALAEHGRDGDLIVLIGGLGAGKTAFVQGYAAALGVTAPVTSPTFTLANRYEGQLVVNHLDAYRVEQLVEARDLAIPELLEDGVTLVEWGDVILPELPDERVEIRFDFGAGDDDRRFDFTLSGPAWLGRHGALVAALAEWVD